MLTEMNLKWTAEIPLHRKAASGRQQWHIEIKTVVDMFNESIGSRIACEKAPFMVSVSFSMYFLKIVFGNEWLENVFEKDRSHFIKMVNENMSKSEIVTINHRIVELAELIFNFHRYEGVEHVLDCILGGKLEYAHTELLSARLLRSYGVPFRFHSPRGIRGRDYDLDVRFPTGTLGCAETKCKIEAMQFDAGNFQRTLDEARKQLNKEMPGAIIVKIPGEWFLDGDRIKKIGDVCSRFFKNTKRVVCVIICGTIFEFSAENCGYNDGFRVKQFINENHRFGAKFLPVLINRFTTPSLGEDWVRFWNLFLPLKRVNHRIAPHL